MSTELFQMPWRVALGGYRWILASTRWQKRREPYLSHGIPRNNSYEARQYLPLVDVPDLFLILANLPPTQKSIKSFADQYGLLWLDEDIPDRRSATPGVPIYEWRYEILELRRTVDAWRLALSHKQPLDQEHQKRINERLKKWSFIRLLRNEKGRLQLSVRPTNLAGVAWFQLAQAVTQKETPDYRPCRMCGGMIYISYQRLTGKRSDSIYCSNACRQKAHRQRDKQHTPSSQQMKQKGIPGASTQESLIAKFPRAFLTLEDVLTLV
jgi:hypothetical protein